jgi:hypothetical protein
VTDLSVIFNVTYRSITFQGLAVESEIDSVGGDSGANVAVMPEVTIEVGKRRMTVEPTILRYGDERGALRTRLVESKPDLRDYETRAGRPFPLVRLWPVG